MGKKWLKSKWFINILASFLFESFYIPFLRNSLVVRIFVILIFSFQYGMFTLNKLKNIDKYIISQSNKTILILNYENIKCLKLEQIFILFSFLWKKSIRLITSKNPTILKSVLRQEKLQKILTEQLSKKYHKKRMLLWYRAVRSNSSRSTRE